MMSSDTINLTAADVNLVNHVRFLSSSFSVCCSFCRARYVGGHGCEIAGRQAEEIAVEIEALEAEAEQLAEEIENLTGIAGAQRS